MPTDEPTSGHDVRGGRRSRAEAFLDPPSGAPVRRLSSATKAALKRLLSASGFGGWLEEKEHRNRANQPVQTLLGLHYRDLVAQGRPLPSLNDVEFRIHSQTGEDGVLLFLFSVLGASTKTCVELCAGDGIECNTANLIINHGWQGLLVDGDPANVARASAYYASARRGAWYTPDIVRAWVTAEGVNGLLAENGFEGEIDLLSLDLDGMDYWVWKALDIVQPRVVVAEFNWTWGPHEARTVPYDPHFSAAPWTATAGWNLNAGASLAALVQLGREKGYRLIGCQSSGFNAYFVRTDIAEQLLPEVSPSDCFELPSLRRGWSPDVLDRLRDGEWVSV